MTTIDHTLHLHAAFNHEGQFTAWSVSNYRFDSKMSEWGFFLHVKELVVQIEVPDEDLRGKASQVVVELMGQMSAAHVARMTTLTFLRDNLLAIGGPPKDISVPAADFESDTSEALVGATIQQARSNAVTSDRFIAPLP